jgi:hypothetical protein
LIEGIFELDFKLSGTSDIATYPDSIERIGHLSNPLDFVIPISYLFGVQVYFPTLHHIYIRRQIFYLYCCMAVTPYLNLLRINCEIHRVRQ